LDGVFFYWIFWIAWVCMMFFVPKMVSIRFSLLFHLLAVMVLSRYIVSIYFFSVQLSGLYMFFVGCIMIRKYSFFKTLVVIMNCFLIAMAYASFQLFMLLDPIWVIVKPIYLQCFFLNYLVNLLVKDWRSRALVLMLGMIVGDLVYGGLLTYKALSYVSLSFAWHDAFVTVLIVQLFWALLEYISKVIYRQTQHRFLLKEKQS
jgi:hypothetical protein